MISDKEIKKLLALPGEARGVEFITDMTYVKNKKGEPELEKFKKKHNQVLRQLDLKTVKNTSWHPAGYRVLFLLLIKEHFKFSDDDIIDMGYHAPRISFVVKTLMRYFVSLEKTFEEASRYWKEHWTIGSLEPHTFDLKNKFLILRLKDFETNPIMYTYWKGYFGAVAELSLYNEIAEVNKKIKVEEKKCATKDGEFHEFLLNW